MPHMGTATLMRPEFMAVHAA